MAQAAFKAEYDVLFVKLFDIGYLSISSGAAQFYLHANADKGGWWAAHDKGGL